MYKHIDSNTPILVGAGVAQQRIDDPFQALQAWQLMTQAVKAAAADAGCEALLTQAERISVPKGIWQYSDPGRLIANDIGAEHTSTVLAEIGILQQSLMSDTCLRIAQGELDIAIVAGGEAKYRELRARVTGVELNDLKQDDCQPDTFLAPADELWSPAETAAGLGMPVGYYAMLESALCHANGGAMDKHLDRLATLYENFSSIAVANPDAWNRTVVTASQIRHNSASNKMLAFPYSKYHNSQWNVDQAAGLIFCSVKKARELRIPEHQWIFALASTESNHMVNVSQRQQLHRCPGARIAGARVLKMGGINIDEVDYLDLYSCFPAAVQIYAKELGIKLNQRPLTITGGMTFAGGPLNNYVLQATCKMVQQLRTQPAATGLISSVSGMLTKQAFALWSNAPGEHAFAFADVTDEVMVVDKPVELVGNFNGEAIITGYTVLFAGDNPSRAVVIGTLSDGKRAVAYNDDEQTMNTMMRGCYCERAISIINGRFKLL